MAAKKKRRRKPSSEELVRSVAAESRRKVARVALVILAGSYLLTIWLDAVASNVPSKLLPRPWVYFAQIAHLFTDASTRVIDYRAEGWSCSEHAWHEIDVRPYFPIDAEDKESRFQRAMQFYRKNRTVMHALEDFVIRRYNASSAHEPIGGVRFLSLRIPFPAPGEKVERYAWRPLSTYPKEIRHDWYWTKKSKRAERCGYPIAPRDEEPDVEPLPSAWPSEKDLEENKP